jgi:hypothetical protein
MKVTRRDASLAKTVLTRMVLDKHVLGTVAAKHKAKDELFASRAENLVAGWAIAHYHKYRKPPGRDIGRYYDRWAASQEDDEVASFVSTFLEHLSEESRKNGKAISSDFAVDLARDHFDLVRAERLSEELQAAVRRGDAEKVKALTDKFRPTSFGDGGIVEILKDREVVEEAVNTIGKPVFTWKDAALDGYFGDTFQREMLIAFEGMAKVGKSFFLQEAAFRALACGCKVAFLEVGDQSRNQLARRMVARMADRPYKADALVRYPVKMEPGEPPEITFDKRSYPEQIGPDEAHAARRKFRNLYGGDALRLSVHPNASITAKGVDHKLEEWKRDGWVPDVLLLDYADILAPMDGKVDSREQINATWMELRAISQRWKLCLVTGTQTDADSYDAKLIRRKNFSGSRTKNDHAVVLFGINQTSLEKEQGIFRVNAPAGRDFEFGDTKVVYCASCLAVANPCVLACF